MICFEIFRRRLDVSCFTYNADVVQSNVVTTIMTVCAGDVFAAVARYLLILFVSNGKSSLITCERMFYRLIHAGVLVKSHIAFSPSALVGVLQKKLYFVFVAVIQGKKLWIQKKRKSQHRRHLPNKMRKNK